MTRRLAAGAARHPWRTIGAWVIAIAVALAAIGALLAGSLTTEGKLTNNPESDRADRLLVERFPQRDTMTELVVVRSERLTVDDPAFRKRVGELWDRGLATGAIAQAVSYYTTKERSLVSGDGHATLIPLRLAGDPEESVKDVISLVREADGVDGFRVAMTGTFTTDHDFNELSQHDLKQGELRIGLPAALLVLVLVFGALVSAFLPLVLALVSIAVALGLTTVVAQGWELSVFVVNMLTGMGLALGIDYSLFVLSRFREERAAGREKVAAITAAGATASRAVLFSGSAYVIAMFGMLLVPDTVMRSLAIGAILVGIVSVTAALTLLPAVLSLLGDRASALRIPLPGGVGARQARSEGRLWSWIVRRVMRRPVVSLAAAGAVLLLAASPVLGMGFGATGIATLPNNLVSKQGFLALERSFPAAGAEPTQIVIDGEVRSPQTQAGIGRLLVSLASDRDFGKPVVTSNRAGDTTLVTVPTASDPQSDRAIAAAERLRSRYVPDAFAGVDARALVGGQTAETIDYLATIRAWLPIVIGIVLALSFVLLTVAFRSLIVAGTAIALNLLSVGAAYGLLTLVFERGVGAGLFGFQQVGKIEAWVPLFLFAVLFGLSMDYQVFLLSRIRERYSASRDDEEAVSFGIGSTARLITGAALIIVAVFAGFAAGDLVMFQQMGFGVAVALLVDATIIRSVLVPAIMTLLGRWNWYLPRWLHWLPHVEVESHDVAAGTSES